MMNKKYLLLSALVFSFGLHAEKIQSIEAYITLHADDNQEAVASYLSKRCAATFLVVAKIFNNEEALGVDEIIQAIINSGLETSGLSRLCKEHEIPHHFEVFR